LNCIPLHIPRYQLGKQGLGLVLYNAELPFKWPHQNSNMGYASQLTRLFGQLTDKAWSAALNHHHCAVMAYFK
jgi:hypothetical protein